MIARLRGALDAMLAALVAPPCATCSRVLDRPLDGAVCDLCWDAVVVAAIPFAVTPLDRACAVGLYDGTLRDIVHALKYDGRRSVAWRLSQLMAVHHAGILEDVDAIVPVPLHARRHRRRGFNQADDLARGLGLPIWRALRRVQSTRPQVELPADARRTNVRDAFALGVYPRMRALFDVERGFNPRRLAGARLVLVDDVTTTGATLAACAQVLRRAGAREVRALTAARVATARR